MKPTDFEESNGLLGGGPGAKYGTTEQVIDLPVHRDGDHVISCWRLTWRERIALLWRGRVWLIVLTPRAHSPVLLTTEAPFKREHQY